MTCGKPVYAPDGALRAVISIGSTLDDIGVSVTQLAVGETGYAFVVDRGGQVIMSRDLAVDGEGHVVGISNLRSDGSPSMQAVVTDITACRKGVAQVEYGGVPVYMAYVPMESMPWTVITVMSVEEVLAPSQRGAANISALASDAEARIDSIMVMEAVIFLAALAAALFMVIGKTLIKDHTTQGRDLGQVFSEVNELLCESNSEGLFITAFEGVLDLETGGFSFVSAGHEMPFIRKADGAFKPYKIRPGFVLAGMEGMRYKMGSMTLQPGDKLFQYTDGVTEATDSQNGLYGMDRLEAVLNRCGGAPDVILSRVKADIDAFVGGAPQFDDITMLCLEFKKKMG